MCNTIHSTSIMCSLKFFKVSNYGQSNATSFFKFLQLFIIQDATKRLVLLMKLKEPIFSMLIINANKMVLIWLVFLTFTKTVSFDFCKNFDVIHTYFQFFVTCSNLDFVLSLLNATLNNSWMGLYLKSSDQKVKWLDETALQYTNFDAATSQAHGLEQQETDKVVGKGSGFFTSAKDVKIILIF